MKSFLKDFQSFALKGNVVDLAVGVIIGTAFGKIVSSLVADVFTPILGLIVGGVDFKKLSLEMVNPLSGTSVALTYGNFLQSVFDFVIIALSIFIFISMMNKAMTKVRKAEEKVAEKAESSDEVKLLTEIRNLLKK